RRSGSVVRRGQRPVGLLLRSAPGTESCGGGTGAAAPGTRHSVSSPPAGTIGRTKVSGSRAVRQGKAATFRTPGFLTGSDDVCQCAAVGAPPLLQLSEPGT